MGIFHCYVRLPEGKASSNSNIQQNRCVLFFKGNWKAGKIRASSLMETILATCFPGGLEIITTNFYVFGCESFFGKSWRRLHGLPRHHAAWISSKGIFLRIGILWDSSPFFATMWGRMSFFFCQASHIQIQAEICQSPCLGDRPKKLLTFSRGGSAFIDMEEFLGQLR